MNRIILLIILSLLYFNGYSQKYEHIFKIHLKGDSETALVIGIESLKLDKDNSELNYIIGKILFDKGQFETAIPYLIKGTSPDNTEDWIQAWSLANLGVCYYMTDNPTKAKDCFNEVLLLNATENVNKFSKNKLKFLQLDSYFDNWEIIETECIRFHLHPKLTFLDVNKFIKLRTDAYLKMNSFFNARPFKKIEFYVWYDGFEAKNFLNKELSFANSNICRINTFYEHTRGHEIAHILTTYGLFPIKTTKFINEGVATYFDCTNRNRLKRAKEDIMENKVDIIELWQNQEKYPLSYNYSVGGAFIEFLLKNGTEIQLKKLIKEQTVEDAEKIYVNLHELVKEFENELKN